MQPAVADPVQRAGDEFGDHVLDALHRPGRDDQRAPPRDIGFREVVHVRQIVQLPSDPKGGHLVGRDDHCGRFAFPKVAAGRFAGHRRTSEDTEQVVTQLKRLTDRGAVSAERREDALVAAGHRRADLQRPAHRVVAGLRASDRQHRGQRRRPGRRR